MQLPIRDQQELSQLIV